MRWPDLGGPPADGDLAERSLWWFVRSRSCEITPAERQALEATLAAEPAFRRAFGELEAVWGGIEPLKDDAGVLAMRRAARAPTERRRLRLTGALAAGLALAVALGLAGRGLLRPGAPPAAEATRAYATAVGQISRVALPDGSVAVLDTDSALRVWRPGANRRVELVRGRAFFDVAKQPEHPFVVLAAGRTVTALGTRFDVYLKSDAVEVTLMQGRVRVERANRQGPAVGPGGALSVEMTPGDHLVAGQQWRLTNVDAPAESGWVEGRLVFDDARLGDVVAELNRYLPDKLAIPDAAAAQRRVSGVVNPADARSFVNAALAMAQRPQPGERDEIAPR